MLEDHQKDCRFHKSRRPGPWHERQNLLQLPQAIYDKGSILGRGASGVAWGNPLARGCRVFSCAILNESEFGVSVYPFSNFSQQNFLLEVCHWQKKYSCSV